MRLTAANHIPARSDEVDPVAERRGGDSPVRIVDHKGLTAQGVGAGNAPVVAALSLGRHALACGGRWGERGPAGRHNNVLGLKLHPLAGGGIVGADIGRYGTEIKALGNAQVGLAGVQVQHLERCV